jgi:hypothetical protein
VNKDLPDTVIALRIALRVAELRVLAAQTACEYWQEKRRLRILQLRDDGSCRE